MAIYWEPPYRITEQVRRIAIRLERDPREQKVLRPEPEPPVNLLSARQAQRQERHNGITKLLATFAADDPEMWQAIYERWLS